MRAQRLAASEVLAVVSFGSLVGVFVCAQRLAASEVLAEPLLLVAQHSPDVLNALRHQRFWQTCRTVRFCSCLKCSTPCGIRGFGSRKGLAGRAGEVRAQRLAASEVLAENQGRGCHGQSLRCSTPCGIRGFGSSMEKSDIFFASSAQRLAASEVLAGGMPGGNTEEERCSTPCGIRGFGSCRPTCWSSAINSAQRLAASEVLAVVGRQSLAMWRLVLNALRHQRFWQTVPSRTGSSLYRAQRLAASEVLAVDKVVHPVLPFARCSTPCGIRGFGRAGASSPPAKLGWCSTPCGIRGFGRSWRREDFSMNPCAQRLAASEVLAEGARWMLFIVLRCSTPCGIRGFGRRREPRLPPR